MLYHIDYISSTSCLGIWHLEETVEELYAQLDNKLWIAASYNNPFEHRKRIMLATRLLLKKMLGEEKGICYYLSGRPYVGDLSHQISVSHTGSYIAIITDKKQRVGIDIEQYTEKVMRVRHRFVAQEEYIDENRKQEHLLIHWSAKEALFKILDPCSIDFVKHIRVKPFQPKDKGIIEIKETLTENEKVYEAQYLLTNEFVMVYIVQ